MKIQKESVGIRFFVHQAGPDMGVIRPVRALNAGTKAPHSLLLSRNSYGPQYFAVRHTIRRAGVSTVQCNIFLLLCTSVHGSHRVHTNLHQFATSHQITLIAPSSRHRSNLTVRCGNLARGKSPSPLWHGGGPYVRTEIVTVLCISYLVRVEISECII